MGATTAPNGTNGRSRMVRRFRQKFTLEDAIGSHAAPLEASRRVPNGNLLGWPLSDWLTLQIASKH